MVVWECALVGKNALSLYETVEYIREWLKGTQTFGEISGQNREHNSK